MGLQQTWTAVASTAPHQGHSVLERSGSLHIKSSFATASSVVGKVQRAGYEGLRSAS